MHKIIGLVVVFLLIATNILYAQTPTIQSPAYGRLPEWSSDSQLFVYQNTNKNFPDITETPSDVFMAAPYWESFNPHTGGLVESNVWPLYPNLSNAEKSVILTDDFIRTSPDGQILVYGSKNKNLTIANRKTHQVFETNIDYEAPDVLPIWWSQDSSGFAVDGAGISPYEPDPIVYYVRLRDRSDLTKTQIYFVRELAPMVVGNRVFSPVGYEHILSIHQDQVLTTMSDLTNWGKAELAAQDAQSYLVIWDAENPEASVIINAFDGGTLLGAAFVPNDPQRLLVILSDGLYTYNIQTHDLQFLSPLNEYYPDDSLVSPDGNWLALGVKTTGHYAFFRTSDLLAIPPLFAPTAFPTFTPVPTDTLTPIPTAVYPPTITPTSNSPK